MGFIFREAHYEELQKKVNEQRIEIKKKGDLLNEKLFLNFIVSFFSG